MTVHQADVIISLLQGILVVLCVGVVATCGLLAYLAGRADRIVRGR